MPKTRKTMLFVLLLILPLQQAQAFFCFRFAMGSRARSHDGPPRHYPGPGVPGFARAPHPSWFLNHSPYPAYIPPSYTEPATPASAPAEIPTPPPGM